MATSNQYAARRCLRLLESIGNDVEQATAFGSEARGLYEKLVELRTLLDEFVRGRIQDAALEAALEALEASLSSFSMASQRCCAQGPLETLFTADQLMHNLVDSCLSARRGLDQLLQHAQLLPTVARAQANMLSVQLSTCTVDFETLRRLQSVRFHLQEQAERVRLGVGDAEAFRGHVRRLLACCTQQQLAREAAFLARSRAEAESAQQVVSANFLDMALSAVGTLVPSGPGRLPADASPRSPRAVAQPQSPAGVRDGAAGPAAVRLAGVASMPPAERTAYLAALHWTLEGSEGSNAAQELLAADGMSHILRLLATAGPGGQRSGALRVLLALLRAEPECAAELVAARGVPVLLHLLAGCAERAFQRGAAAAAIRLAEAAAVAAVAVSAKSPVRKAAPGAGGAVARRGDAAAAASCARQLARSDAAAGAGSGAAEAEQEAAAAAEEEEEVGLLAVAVLRQLSLSHAAELGAAGVLTALVRLASSPCGGRLAAAAVTALSDLATDGLAVVQMLQERLLVALGSMRLSDRPSESAAALACLAAILQHPGRLQPRSGQAGQHGRAHAPPEDCQGSCADMGRACDGASVSVLLDLLVEAAAEDGPVSRSGAAIAPESLLQLLPHCVHTTETRSAVLRHGAATHLLLARVAEADAAAAAVLRRVASEEGSKTDVARRLSRLVVTTVGPQGAAGGGRRAAAAVALCLADVLRPGSRDRAAARWSADACSECEACGAVQPLMAVAGSHDPECRAAGLACLHALALHGNQAVRTALSSAGAVMALVDAVKLDATPLPEVLQSPPACEPCTLGQAAAEALAALATASDDLRKDVVLQLAAFLSSSSPHLAASACQAIRVLLEASPAAGPVLIAQGGMAALVAHLSRHSPGSAQDPALRPAALLTHSASSHHAAAAAAGGGSSGGGGVDQGAWELLQQRAVRLIWAQCRGGGSAVEAAVAAGAAPALLRRLGCCTAAGLQVEAAAALGPLLRKSAAAREAVGSNGGLAALLQLARAAPSELPLWEDAMVATAALAALHAPCRAEAARTLRQMLVRGTAREAVAAAAVVERMSSAAAGREAVLAEDLADPLVRLLTASGDNRAKAAAANAICHLAVPPTVTLPPCAALPAGGAARPRLLLVRAGAASALLALLRDAGEAHAPCSSSASSVASAPSSVGLGASSGASTQASSAGSGGSGQASPGDAALVAAAEALESLAAGQEGAQAIRAAGGVEVLKATVARGKRRQVPAAAAKAASAALLQCV